MDSSVAFSCLTKGSIDHQGNYPGVGRKKSQDTTPGWEGATPVIRYRVFITDSHNGDFCNFDHIPVYMDLVSNFTWGKNNSGGRQIGTEKK